MGAAPGPSHSDHTALQTSRPRSADARPASTALSVLRILRKARRLWSHPWDPQSNTCLPQHLARPPGTLGPWGSWLKSCPTLARGQSPRVAVPAPFSLCPPHGSRSQGPRWQVPTVGPAGVGELCPTGAPVSLPVPRVVHSPSLGLGGRADSGAVAAVPEHPSLLPQAVDMPGLGAPGSPPAQALPASVCHPLRRSAGHTVRATATLPEAPCDTAASLPGHAARWGWGRGRPTGAESAAPAWSRPHPGRDVGEVGGGGGAAPIFGGAVNGWGFSGKWLLQEPGLEGRRGRVGWGGVGMRGRAFPEDRPFPNNTKKGEGRGPTSLSGGKEALSQHRAGLPLPIRRRRGQGLSRSADVNTRGRPSGPPFLRRSGGHAPPERGRGGGRPPAPAILPVGAASSPRLCTQVRAVGGHGGLSVVSLPGPAKATLEPRGYL